MGAWGSPLALCPVRWAGRGVLFCCFLWELNAITGNEGSRRSEGRNCSCHQVLLLGHTPPGPSGFPANQTVPGKGGLSPLFVGSSSFSADVNGWDVVREPGLPFGCEKLNVDCYFPPSFSGELLRRLRDFFRNNTHTHTHGAPVHFRLRPGIIVGICALHTKNRKLQFADLKMKACCYLQLSFS